MDILQKCAIEIDTKIKQKDSNQNKGSVAIASDR